MICVKAKEIKYQFWIKPVIIFVKLTKLIPDYDAELGAGHVIKQ